MELGESSPRDRVGGLSGSVYANASLMDLRGERPYNAALVVVVGLVACRIFWRLRMFSGSYVALVTPFKDGEVDLERLGALVDFHIESGTNGLVPCGTTGESATLSHKEHELVIESVIERAAGRIPVLAGTGSNSTSEAVSLTKSAQAAGADGALVITPYYNKPPQEGLYSHFAAIAHECELPIVLYNVPGRTGIDLLPQTVGRLAAIENVVAVKEASGSIDRTVEILGECDITVLSGDDSLTLSLMAVGASGVISVAANVVPAQMVELVQLASAGEIASASRLHHQLYPLMKALFVETSPIPVKACLEMQGLIGGELRLPLVGAEDDTRSLLRGILEGLEISA